MDRLTKIFYALALVTVLAGLTSCYRLYRPSNAGEWPLAVRHYTPRALANPLVPIAALAALAAALATQILERRPAYAERSTGAHRLDVHVAAQDSGGPQPVLGPRRQRQQQRPHLEAYLHGAGDVVGFVDELLASAITAAASDVHVQPLEGMTRLAFRIAGELEEVAIVPRSRHDEIVRRLKVLAGLVTYQTDRPQDGHIALDTPVGAVDLRVSVLPTNHGEKVVLRLARAADRLLDLDRLGMPEALRQRLEKLLAEPQGVLFLTGPTGSGKTTTLYGSLAHIHETRGEATNIATIEDPIEVDLPFLNQTERAPELPFQDALRSVLRQDPDVLMVGEIRDPESAKIAIQAGLTGHLILTTLHSESSAGVFNRLIDLGVEPFLVASSVLAVVSQRLVRRLCPECRHPAALGRSQRQLLLAKGIAADDLVFQVAEGCRTCDRTGVAGRAAVFELLEMSPSLRQLVTSKETTPRIAEHAAREGMAPLLRSAIAEAVAGSISLEEVLRVAG